MSETFRSKKGGGWNILDSFNWVNKKHQDENQKISRVKKQPNEEEKKGDQAEDDKLEGTEKEKKLEGQSSSQEPTPTTPPEKEPEGDKDEENDKDKKPEEAEGLEEDKDNNINPGDLNITWGNDPRYWKPLDKRSTDPAELIAVCWLQVTGSKRVTRGKSYEIKFNISLQTDAFGWKGLPLFLMAKIGEKGKYIWKKIKPLEQTTTANPFDIPNPDEKFIVKIPADKGDGQLFFGLYEIWSNQWKGGLCINYATVEEVSSPG